MDKKRMQVLVSKSYVRQKLNPERVKAIAKTLTRADLKRYIHELKNKENKRNVIVILPFDNKFKKQVFENLFPGRRIIYKVDPTLLVGVKIIDNDTVYTFDLKDTLESIPHYIKEKYD